MVKSGKYPKIEKHYIGDIVLKDELQGSVWLEIETDINLFSEETQNNSVKIKFETDYTASDLKELKFDYSFYMKHGKYWVKSIKLENLMKEIEHLKNSGLVVNSNLDKIIAKMI